MGTHRILVTGVSGDIGYSCVRSLFQEGCYTIYGTDISPLCPVCDQLAGFWVIPSVTAPNYLETLLHIIKKYDIEILLPTSEPEILFLNSNREIFRHIPCKLLINKADIINCFSSKYRTAILVNKIGFRAPRTYLLSDYDFSLTYPLIAKPDRGSGGAAIFILRNECDFIQIKNTDTPYVIQEYLPGEDQEYTTTVFSDGEKAVTVTFRRMLKNGVSHYVELVHSPYMQALGEKISSAVQLYGSINIQTRKVQDEHFIFEINPRLSSTIFFRSMVGFRDAHWWIQALLGTPVSSYSLTRHTFRGMRFLSEVCLNDG